MCRRHWDAFGCNIPSLCSRSVFTVALTPARPWMEHPQDCRRRVCFVDPMLNSTPARARLDSAPTYSDNLVTKLLWSQGRGRSVPGEGKIWTQREGGSILRTCRPKCQCQCEGRYSHAIAHAIILSYKSRQGKQAMWIKIGSQLRVSEWACLLSNSASRGEIVCAGGALRCH